MQPADSEQPAIYRESPGQERGARGGLPVVPGVSPGAKSVGNAPAESREASRGTRLKRLQGSVRCNNAGKDLRDPVGEPNCDEIRMCRFLAGKVFL